jgi:hypothetical protein
VRRILPVLVAALVLAAPAHAGGPFMVVGAADDVVKAQDRSRAQAEMDLLKLAGLDTIRVTTIWSPGDRKLDGGEEQRLANVVEAAGFDGVRVIVTIMPKGSSTTPLTDPARSQFAAFAADVARTFPAVKDFVIGNEPNLNRFWLPQYDPLDGHDVAAPAYLELLAETYDAIKAVRPLTTVYGGALAPRGVDKAGTARDTHSPTAFLLDMGTAYRASGRQLPVMDALAIHPYPETSSIGPDFPHPNSSSIGLADYDKLVAILGQAFDGTSQRGSALPILYEEFGIETTVPADKSTLYNGAEPSTTKPVDVATQAAFYRRAIQLAFCQKTVLGILLFHVVDEASLPAWQSGLYYVDGQPKESMAPVRDAALESRRGVISRCDGLELTPKVAAVYPPVERLKSSSFSVSLTCSIDCAYRVRLERISTGRVVQGYAGSAIGRTAKLVRFVRTRPLSADTYRFTLQATATVNAGAPFVTASRPLRLR